jgi:heparosan-N-sulfate-glucuronate 5-epimerase
MTRLEKPAHLCHSQLADPRDVRKCICPLDRCLGGDCEACFGSTSAPLLPGPHVEEDRVRGYYIDFRVRARFPRTVPPWVTPREFHVATCQAGLASYERFLAGDGEDWLAGAIAVGRWLVEHQTRGGIQDGGWQHLEAYAHTFALRPPWLSAMAQGEGASLLVRLYLETADEAFAEAAQGALKPLAIPTEQGGVQALLGGRAFPEEYPTSPPSFVLNGAFFALWGCYDVWLGLGEEDAGRAFRDGVETLAVNLHRWDTGYWSRYDLHPHPVAHVASASYHQLHINLLRAMSRIAPRREFADNLALFEEYAASKMNQSRAFVRKAMFRLVVPRNSVFALRLPWARTGPGTLALPPDDAFTREGPHPTSTDGEKQ